MKKAIAALLSTCIIFLVCVEGQEHMNSAGNGVSFPAEFRIFPHFSPYIAPQNATYAMAKLIKLLKI